MVASRSSRTRKTRSWTGDVLDTLIAEILEFDVFQSVTNLITHRAGDADAAWLGRLFEARRHIDAVAEDVVFLDDYVHPD